MKAAIKLLLICWVCRPLQCQYFHETDTLNVYFVKATPGLIDNTEDALPGLLVDYNQEHKVVGFDVRMASVRTGAHFGDTATSLEGASPLSLQTAYSHEAGTVTVSFVARPQYCRSVCTDDSRISVWVSDSGKWESIVLHGLDNIAS